jgi:CPA1 family monovalent cation:H+ antiporter
MDIVVVVTIISSLFLVIAAAEPLAAKVGLPYSAILAILGILIGAGAIFFLNTELTDVLQPVAEAIVDFPIKSNVFLYVFLPTLLFQATLGMNIRRMFDDWVPILVLAIVAVFVATLSVGYALSWASSLPLAACLLIGAIVSTTDPAAVVGIFRSISAPQRLMRIIEGESLLNDAAAIALFGLFSGLVVMGLPDPTLASAVEQFPLLMVGGALTGWLIARAAIWAMALLARYERAQLSVSVALPYLAYIVAEQSVGASGVIAVVTSGLALNLAGPGRLQPMVWANLREVWDLLAHWAGALIFILAALLIPRVLEEVRAEDFALILVVIAAATGARAVVLFGLMPLLTGLRLSPRVQRPFRVAILWGGLRGALTLALALAVTESIFVPLEIKRLVGILATGYTLFTLLVQGTTLRWVIGKLGLDRLSPIDQALSNQVIAVALQTVREEVSETTDNYELNRDIVRTEAKHFAERLDRAVEVAENEAEILDRDRITLGLIALAGAERDAFLNRIKERTISLQLAQMALLNADRLIEGARVGGRLGYQRAARKSAGYGTAFQIADFMHNRLHLSFLLVRLTADKFEMLLSQRLILKDLDQFIDTRIRRIHGRRVAELLKELLSRRVEAVETTLDGLQLQYPGYALELERRFIRRTALRLEEREYTSMRDDGLVGAELYTSLIQDVAARQRAAEDRPPLDIGLRRSNLVRQFPLFAGFAEKDLKLLTRSLRPLNVNAGETIIEKDTPAKSVYFIASGAVEVEIAGQRWRLGRGDMFGQLALLMEKPRKIEVRAIAPTHLMVLNEVRFRKVLKKSDGLRAAVEDSARKRGVEIALDGAKKTVDARVD